MTGETMKEIKIGDSSCGLSPHHHHEYRLGLVYHKNYTECFFYCIYCLRIKRSVMPTKPKPNILTQLEAPAKVGASFIGPTPHALHLSPLGVSNEQPLLRSLFNLANSFANPPLVRSYLSLRPVKRNIRERSGRIQRVPDPIRKLVPASISTASCQRTFSSWFMTRKCI